MLFWVVLLYLMSTESLSTEWIHKKYLSQKEHTYATVMQASLTTWDLRSFAESLSAPSNKRKCWKKQSYCAAPATSNDRIFLSWSKENFHYWHKECQRQKKSYQKSSLFEQKFKNNISLYFYNCIQTF